MSRREELEGMVREWGTLIERLEECRRRIGRMCSERRPPKMTIPVQWNDDDFFISVTLDDAISVLKEQPEFTQDKNMTLDELKTINKALSLLVPTNKMQARAMAMAQEIINREINAFEEAAKPKSKKCICNTYQLENYGCLCGAR